jgi:DNA polymerase-3 subunit gamma/tau
VLADLAEFTHFVTRVKIVPAVADDRSLAESERTRGRAFAVALSMRTLSRTWQMLFKGLPEVQTASKPIAAAEMVLVRIAYAADLPTPDEVIRSLSDQASTVSRPQNGGTATAPTAPTAPTFSTPRHEPSRGGPRAALAPASEPIARRTDSRPEPSPLTIARFEDLIALAAEKRDLSMKTALERDVRLVHFEDGRLELALEPSVSKTLIGDLSRRLSDWTGRRWMVVVSAEQGRPSIKSQNDARRAELLTGVRADPLVQAVLARFPGAEIVAVRQREPEGASALPSADADEAATDDTIPDDTPAFGAHRNPDDADGDI